MKRKILFGLLAIVGLMLAICVTDNSDYEILIRFIGVAMFFTGALLGGWMDNDNKHKPNRYGTSAK